MSDIIKFNSDREIVTEQNGEIVRECNDLAEMTEEMLLDARKEIANTKTLSAPIAELALLGTGVASLIPALRKVTQTTTFNTQGLYQLANAGVGDTLKIAKKVYFNRYFHSNGQREKGGGSTAMKKQKLNYRFHNPNTAEVTADYILKVFIEANMKKVERAMQEVAEKGLEEDKQERK